MYTICLLTVVVSVYLILHYCRASYCKVDIVTFLKQDTASKKPALVSLKNSGNCMLVHFDNHSKASTLIHCI